MYKDKIKEIINKMMREGTAFKEDGCYYLEVREGDTEYDVYDMDYNYVRTVYLD